MWGNHFSDEIFRFGHFLFSDLHPSSGLCFQTDDKLPWIGPREVSKTKHRQKCKTQTNNPQDTNDRGCRTSQRDSLDAIEAIEKGLKPDVKPPIEFGQPSLGRFLMRIGRIRVYLMRIGQFGAEQWYESDG